MTFLKDRGVIVLKDFEERGVEQVSKKISSKTINTWQKERSEEEKLENTTQGKLAENILEKYLSIIGVRYISYDSFRKNNLKKHAPFDGLIVNNEVKEEVIRLMIQKIIDEVEKSYSGQISEKLIQELINNKLYPVEVKSTKVADRHKVTGNIIDTIKKDDFLEYPRYIRSSNEISNAEEYLNYIKQRGMIQNISLKELERLELPHMKYFYIRIYIDYETKIAYIIGYINRNDFFMGGIKIKKMIKRGKSEYAVYIYKELIYAKEIDKIILEI